MVSNALIFFYFLLTITHHNSESQRFSPLPLPAPAPKLTSGVAAFIYLLHTGMSMSSHLSSQQANSAHPTAPKHI